jgi:flagellar hook-associated protein 1 FlgK
MSVSEFSGYNIARNMFNTFQTAMDVTGNNIANASNASYSTQRAVITASPPLVNIGGVGNIGGGSQVSSIERQRDSYVDVQRTGQQGALGAANSLSQGLNQLQALWNNGNGQGLSTAVDDLSSAFSSLSSQPDSVSLRQGVIDSATALTTQMQQSATDLGNLQQQSDQQVGDEVTQVNQLSNSVAQLNVQISGQLATGQQPNDLMDQRQADIEQLGTLTGAQSSEMANGMINLNVGGHWLVAQDRAATINSTPDPARPGLTSFTWADNGQAYAPSGGETQAALDMRDVEVPDSQTKLNGLAAAMISDFNGLQASGYALNSATPGGTQFFTGTSAANIQVDPALASDPQALAAATTASAPGDGSQAAAFAALNGSTNASLGMSYTSALATWSSEAGASASLASQQQTTQQGLMNQLNTLTSSVSGVSINTEATNLSEYEQAYQAGARYVGVLDTMMQTLLTAVAN